MHIQLKSLSVLKLALPHSVSAWLACTQRRLVWSVLSCIRVGRGDLIPQGLNPWSGLCRQLCSSSAVMVGASSVVAAGRKVGSAAASVVVAWRVAAAVLLRPWWSGWWRRSRCQHL
jgi:hypothetical protein